MSNSTTSGAGTSAITGGLLAEGAFLGWAWLHQHLGTTLLAVLLANVLWTRYRSGLRQIPGPFLASFSNLWKLQAVWKQNMHRANIRVHEDYGPIVRIGPNHVSVADPASMQIIYGVKNVWQKVCVAREKPFVSSNPRNIRRGS